MCGAMLDGDFGSHLCRKILRRGNDSPTEVERVIAFFEVDDANP